MISFTDFESRIPRSTFIGGNLIIFTASLLVGAISTVFSTERVEILLSIVLTAVWIVPTFSLYIRRFHDLDQSGYWSLTIFLPLVNFIVFGALCLIPGTSGPNRFGAIPDNSYGTGTKSREDQPPSATNESSQRSGGGSAALIEPSSGRQARQFATGISTMTNSIFECDEWKILIEYDPRVGEAFESIRDLRAQYRVRFAENLLALPAKDRDPKAVATALRQDQEKEDYISDREDIRVAFGQARAMCPEAAEEFRRIYEVVGDSIDASHVLEKLKVKFSDNPLFIMQNKIICEHLGSCIVELQDGVYSVVDKEGRLIPGALKYKSIETAKDYIEWLQERS